MENKIVLEEKYWDSKRVSIIKKNRKEKVFCDVNRKRNIINDSDKLFNDIEHIQYLPYPYYRGNVFDRYINKIVYKPIFIIKHYIYRL